MTDERLLTAAKLYEQVSGRLDGDERLMDHAGLPLDENTATSLTFLDGLRDDSGRPFSETELGRLVDSSARTRVASEAVRTGHAETLSYLVGVTEQDLDASSLMLPARILDVLESDGTLTTCLLAGRPNTGKTNTTFLLRDLYRTRYPDLLCLSNSTDDTGTDTVVTSMHDLMIELLENRDRPKFVIVDEGSTHFDGTTHRKEVREQWGPAVKRFSKMGVHCNAVVGHTGKDVHPEHKRLTNLGIWKDAKDQAGFYSRWPDDSDRPTEQMFAGDLTSLEPTESSYDPDDPAAWSWDLRPDLFGEQYSDWSHFLDELRDRGRAE